MTLRLYQPGVSVVTGNCMSVRSGQEGDGSMSLGPVVSGPNG